MFAFLDPILLPVHSLLESAATVLPMPLCVVLLTLLVRLALHPLTRATYRAGLHRRRLAPQIKALQQQHGKDAARLSQELATLHREEGVSPAAGCLPALVQLPIIALVYRLFSAPVIDGEANSLLAHTLAGVPLSAHLTTVGSGHLWLFLGLLAIALVVAALIARQTRAHLDLDAALAPAPMAGSGASGAKTAQAEAVETAGQLMTKIVPWMAFGTVFAVAVMPLASGLYLVTSAIWTYVERSAVRATVRL